MTHGPLDALPFSFTSRSRRRPAPHYISHSRLNLQLKSSTFLGDVLTLLGAFSAPHMERQIVPHRKPVLSSGG